jgi:hypothetical protein
LESGELKEDTVKDDETKKTARKHKSKKETLRVEVSDEEEIDFPPEIPSDHIEEHIDVFEAPADLEDKVTEPPLKPDIQIKSLQLFSSQLTAFFENRPDDALVLPQSPQSDEVLVLPQSPPAEETIVLPTSIPTAGFFYVNKISGTDGNATCYVLVRDFDKENEHRRVGRLMQFALATEAAFPGRTATVKVVKLLQTALLMDEVVVLLIMAFAITKVRPSQMQEPLSKYSSGKAN